MTSGEYEDFVHRVCQALVEGDGVVLQRNKGYIGRVSGRRIKVDVSFETQLLGARILMLVECKCYKQTVEVGDVEEFHSKLDDIGAHKGIMITTVGYQSGAIKVAKGRGIALALLRENQQPDELALITKAAARPETSSFLRGNFRPWGRFSGPQEEAGFRFESIYDILYLLAFSMPEELERLRSTRR